MIDGPLVTLTFHVKGAAALPTEASALPAATESKYVVARIHRRCLKLLDSHPPKSCFLLISVSGTPDLLPCVERVSLGLQCTVDSRLPAFRP